MKDHVSVLQIAPRIAPQRWLFLWTLSFAWGATSLVLAEAAHVHFDIAPLISCRDITTAEFAAANPDERLLEARLEISTLLGDALDAEVQEYFFRISSPGQTLFVADYQPKTTLASDYAGTISVEKKGESTKSVGLTVSGVWNHLVKIAGSGDVGSKDSVATRYELLAPMEPVTASGTVFRGTGVYFKVRPSRRTSLEGSRPFTLIFRAPADLAG